MLAFLSLVISFTVCSVRFSTVLVAPRRLQGFLVFFFFAPPHVKESVCILIVLIP